MELIALLGLAVVALALIGLIQVIRWIVYGLTQDPQAIRPATLAQESTSPPPLATVRQQLDAMHSRGEITASSYQEVCEALERAAFKAAELSEGTTNRSPLPSEVAGNVARPVSVANPQPADSHPLQAFWKAVKNAAIGPIPPPRSEVSAAPGLPTPSVASSQPADSLSPIAGQMGLDASRDPGDVYRTQTPAATAIVPRRPLGTLLRAFMEERNIRWGEIASGILIVGSAIGLVISLRNELRDTIPYFPALMFLSITLAIHLAGTYTLRKWKLRQTSRGVLLIGLILIPLNFLAGALLTAPPENRRAVSDPAFIAAIAVGFGVLSWVAWSASRILLRRGHWRVVIAVLAAGAFIVIANRLDRDFLRANRLTLALPIFSICTVLLGEWIWRVRQRHFCNRLLSRTWLISGLILTSLLVALGIFVAIDANRPTLLKALAPGLGLTSTVVGWQAAVVMTRARDRRLRMHRLFAAVLAVFAVALLAAVWIQAAVAPFELFWLGLLSGAALLAAGWLERVPLVGALGMASLVASGIVGLHVAIDELPWTSDTTARAMQHAFVGGWSGLFWMAGAVLLLGLTPIVRKRLATTNSHGKAGRWKSPSDSVAWQLNSHFLASGAMALGGCATALIAARLNEWSIVDTTIGTGLLIVMAIALLIGSLMPRRPLADWKRLPHAASLLTVVAAAEALLFNPFIQRALGAWGEYWSHRVALVLTASSVVLALTAAMARWIVPQGETVNSPWRATRIAVLGDWVSLTQFFGFAAAFVALWTANLAGLVWVGIGLTASVMVACWADRSRAGWSVPAATLALAIFLVMLRHQDSQATLESLLRGGHWVGQSLAIALWASVWIFVQSHLFQSQRWGWLAGRIPSDLWLMKIVPCFVTLAMLVWVLAEAYGPVSDELTSRRAEGLQLRANWIDIWPRLLAAWGVWLGVALLGMFRTRSVWFGRTAAIAASGLFCMQWVHWAPLGAAATALRWQAALAGFVTSLAFWFPRKQVERISRQWFGKDVSDPWLTPRWRADVIAVSVAVTIALSSLISVAAAAVYLMNLPAAVANPTGKSVLLAMPRELSYGLSSALALATLLSYAASQRRVGYAWFGTSCVVGCLLLIGSLALGAPLPRLAVKHFKWVAELFALGMVIYGVAWFLVSRRIEASRDEVNPTVLLRAHFICSACVLVLLSVVIAVQALRFPDLPGMRFVIEPTAGWAVVALGLWMVATWFVIPQWRRNFTNWMIGAAVLCAAPYLGCLAHELQQAGGTTTTWVPYQIMTCGFVAAIAAQFGIAVAERRRQRYRGKAIAAPASSAAFWGGVTLATVFSVNGIAHDFEQHHPLQLVVLVVVVLSVAWGSLHQSLAAPWITAALVTVQLVIFEAVDPEAPVAIRQAGFVRLWPLAMALLAIVWMAAYLIDVRWLKRRPWGRWATLMIDVVLICSSFWILWLSSCRVLCLFDSESHALAPHLCDRLLLIASLSLALLGTWNPRTWLRVLTRFVLTIGLAGFVAGSFDAPVQIRLSVALINLAFVLLAWGIALVKWPVVERGLSAALVPRRAAWYWQIRDEMPLLAWMTTLFVLLAAWGHVWAADLKPFRFLAAAAPGLCGAAWLAIALARRVAADRYVSLGCFSVCLILLSWADVEADLTIPDWSLAVAIRSYLVLSGLVFGYGLVVSRWVSDPSDWRDAIRRTSLGTAVLAIINLGVLVILERLEATPLGVRQVGAASALVVAFWGVALVAGLTAIAVMPRHDPLSLSLHWRKLYVYAAQLVVALLLVHLLTTVPALVRLGLREYWPYLAMATAFVAAAVGNVLERRRLPVLGDPLINTMYVGPIVTAIVSSGLETKADTALVLLMAGGVYGFLTWIRPSIWCGLAAAVFGNLALWTYYGRFPDLSFTSHPQLWLIPPALMALVAGEMGWFSLRERERSAIRYTALAVIYISSTIEVFLAGLGDKLWPPMVLATLAVVGMLAGMLLRLRAYIYLGGLFLLLAMTAMVSHAHRQLDHVWPWWVFGITLGVAILTLFAVFEQRRSRIREARRGRQS